MLRLLWAVCLLTALGVQTVSAGGSFLCRCTGSVLVTQADHCAGEHDGVGCQHATASTHEHEQGEGGVERHEFAAHASSVGQKSGSVQAPVAIPILVAILMADELIWKERDEARRVALVERLSVRPPVGAAGLCCAPLMI